MDKAGLVGLGDMSEDNPDGGEGVRTTLSGASLRGEVETAGNIDGRIGA